PARRADAGLAHAPATAAHGDRAPLLGAAVGGGDGHDARLLRRNRQVRCVTGAAADARAGPIVAGAGRRARAGHEKRTGHRDQASGGKIMNGDVEELLRESMDRSTADMRVPADMLARARTRVRHRQLAIRAALACGTAAVTAAAVVAVTVPGAQPGTGVTNARTTAYVIKRVQSALAAANFVIQGQATGTMTVSVHGRRVPTSDGL